MHPTTGAGCDGPKHPHHLQWIPSRSVHISGSHTTAHALVHRGTMPSRILQVLVLIGSMSLLLVAQEAEHFVAQRIWTMDSAGEEAFLSVMGIAPASDGSILVSDKLANSLICIGSDRHVKRKLQRKGKTPGALNGPGLVAVSDTQLAVADFASERIQIFTMDLMPVAEIRAVGPVFSMAFDEKGFLWVGAMRGVEGETLFRYDREGREVLRRNGQASRGTMFDDMFHLVASGEKVYLVYITRNVVEQWNLGGAPLGTTTVSGFPSAVPSVGAAPTRIENQLAVPGILFAGCATDGKGRVRILAGDAAPHPRRDVVEINERGEIVSLVTLPERASGIRIDSQGQIVAIENHKRKVSCYRLRKSK